MERHDREEHKNEYKLAPAQLAGQTRMKKRYTNDLRKKSPVKYRNEPTCTSNASPHGPDLTRVESTGLLKNEEEKISRWEIQYDVRESAPSGRGMCESSIAKQV